MSDDRIPIIILPECPYCTRHDVAFYFSSARKMMNSTSAVFFYNCGNCGHGICCEASDMHISDPHYLAFHDIECIYPKPNVAKAPEFTPEQVASDFLEAVSSLKNGNYKASSLMTRTSLETAVNLFKAQGNNLKQKINFLAEQHIITAALAEWAHEIRDIGNDSAHGPGPITEKDAKDAVDFAEMLYTYLFELPGRIAKRRKSP